MMIVKPELKMISISQIWWGDRYRDDLGDLSGLKASILEKGIIQPVSVCQVPVENEGDSPYKLLTGERRITAIMELIREGNKDLSDIPAIIRSVEDEADEREVELYENVFRKDFSWDERVKLVNEIDRLNKAKDSNWSLRKTADYLGCGVATVSRQTQLAAALEIMPELADEAKTEADAFKILKKLEEKHVTQELHNRQATRVSKSEMDFLRIADSNYIVGDVFKGLASLKNNGIVNFIECDPPYGIDLNEMKKVEGPTSTVKSYNEVESSEYKTFMTNLSKELYRVAGKDCWMIMWYGPSNHQIVLEALRDSGWFVGEIPAMWVKPSGQTMQPSTNLANCYEPFFVCRKGNPVLCKQGRSNVFSFPPVHGPKKYHPTERPLHLIQEILNTFCFVGAVVLVPFVGSGATLRSCYLEGMKCFGFDLNDEYKPKFMLAVEEDLRKLNGDEGES